MEKLRHFERRCLRACPNRYRTPESNFVKFYRTTVLYKEAKINRIDCFLLRIAREHFASVRAIKSNDLICTSMDQDPQYFERTLQIGLIPPAAFIYLDKLGYLQDKNNIPTLYHIVRPSVQKSIHYERDIDCLQAVNLLRFNTDISVTDKMDNHRKNTKRYWWLADNECLNQNVMQGNP